MRQKGWKGFFIYFGIGLVGIATIYPIQKQAILAAMEDSQIQIDLPVEVVTIVSLINPLFLLVVGLFLGMFLAKKVQLSSFIFHRLGTGTFLNGIAKGWKRGVYSGFALGLFTMIFDQLLRPFLPDVFHTSSTKPSVYDLLSGVLYGGVVEELMMRWGLMTLFVYLIWKLFDRENATPPKFAYIIAILFSAFFFSIGHYGATNALTELTPLVWFRMIVLNSVAGIIFGWLYWKDQLETAIISHMSAHIAMFCLTWLFL